MNTIHVLGYLNSEPLVEEREQGLSALFSIKLKEGPHASDYYIYTTAYRLGAEFVQKKCKVGDLLAVNGYLTYDRKGRLYIRSFRIDNLNLSMQPKSFFPKAESFDEERKKLKSQFEPDSYFS